MQKIRKGDKVQLIRGAGRPQTKDEKSKPSGEVLIVHPDKGTCIVSGQNLVWKHKKGTGPDNPGGRTQLEAEVQLSNVLYFDEELGRAEKVGFKEMNGRRVRYLKKSGKVIG
ncbi:MAG: 50S ribosomal protein L24 [Planctomycetes bacterium]|nr:50S ribosomal protein L24 [Planctomycetota bacterium]NUQ34667.1 50S ribosomal protein L24 [Planctomycetaceae bacterium]